MRRLLRGSWVMLAGGFLAVAAAIVVAINAPSLLARDARAAEVIRHEERLDELAGDEDALRARIQTAQERLKAQNKDKDAAQERVAEQERRIGRLQDRIEELGG